MTTNISCLKNNLSSHIKFILLLSLAFTLSLSLIYKVEANQKINYALKKYAKVQNNKLPLVTSDGSKYFKVEAGNMLIKHYYQLATSPYPSVNSLFVGIKRQVCAYKNTNRMMGDGISFEYNYFNKNGIFLYKFTINKSNC